MKDVIIIIMAVAMLILTFLPLFFGANGITVLFALTGIVGLFALDTYGDNSK